MSEEVISFFDCCEVPQQAVITVRSKAGTAYTYMAKAARRFRGWLTVSANAVCRRAARSFRREFGVVRALFNRTVWIRQGALRL